MAMSTQRDLEKEMVCQEHHEQNLEPEKGNNMGICEEEMSIDKDVERKIK